MDDNLLVEKILSGNQEAVRTLYRLYSNKMLCFIKTKADPSVSEEILQDTFISVLQSLPGFAGRSSLYSWMCGICRHEIADYYRKQKIKEVVFSRIPILKKIVTQALSPEVAFEEKELKEKITHTFKGLSEGYRQILRLRYIDGYSVTELSKKLGLSYKSCESKLFRARVAFQKTFAEKTGNLHQGRDFIGFT